MSNTEIEKRIELARSRVSTLETEISRIYQTRALLKEERALLEREELLKKELKGLKGLKGSEVSEDHTKVQEQVPVAVSTELTMVLPNVEPVIASLKVPIEVPVEVPLEKAMVEPMVESMVESVQTIAKKSLFAHVVPDEYNWGLLNNTIPPNFPFYKDTLEVLGQFPKGTYDFLATNDKAPSYFSSYLDLVTYIQDRLPKGSRVNPLVTYDRLSASLTASILGVTELAVQQMVCNGELVGVKHTSYHYSIFSADLLWYILKNLVEKEPEKYLRYMTVIPQLFPAAVYDALMGDHNFAKLEKNCIFGFNLITNNHEIETPGLSEHKWNKAHLKLREFHPTIAEWMDSTGRGVYFGTSSVRLWFKTYYPNLLEGIMKRHEEYSAMYTQDKVANPKVTRGMYLGLAYLEFLVEFSQYDKKSHQLVKPFGDVYDQKVKFLTNAEFLTPTELGRVTGTSNILVNQSLMGLGYQITKAVKGGSQWVPTDTSLGIGLVLTTDLGRLSLQKDTDSCFTLHWRAKDVIPILSNYLAMAKAQNITETPSP